MTYPTVLFYEKIDKNEPLLEVDTESQLSERKILEMLMLSKTKDRDYVDPTSGFGDNLQA